MEALIAKAKVWLRRLEPLLPQYGMWYSTLLMQRLQHKLAAWQPMRRHEQLKQQRWQGGDAGHFADGLLLLLALQHSSRIVEQQPLISLPSSPLVPPQAVGHFAATDVTLPHVPEAQRQLESDCMPVAPTCYTPHKSYCSVLAVCGPLFKAHLPTPRSRQRNPHPGYRLLLLRPADRPAHVYYVWAVVRADQWLPLVDVWRKKVLLQPDRQPASLAELQEQRAVLIFEKAMQSVGGVQSRLISNAALLVKWGTKWAHKEYTTLVSLLKAELMADLHVVAPGMRAWWEADEQLWPVVLEEAGLLREQQRAWGARIVKD